MRIASMSAVDPGLHYPIDLTALPKNWEACYIGDRISDIQPGFASGVHNQEGKGVAHLRPMNVDRQGSIDLSLVKSVPDTGGPRLREGDVLFNNTNSPELIGKTAAISGSEDWAFSNHMTRLRPPPTILGKFVAHQLHFVWMSGYFRHRCVKHVNQASISSGTLARSVPLILPPLPEQRQIVAEIEKQFTRLEAGVAALRRVQANLKRYRAAVLKAGCEGRLVPTEAEWKQIPLQELIGKISQGWSPKCDLTREALPDEWAIVTTTAVQSMRYIDNQGKPLPAAFKPRPHIEIQAGDFLVTRKGPRKRAGVACLVRSTRSRLMVCDTVYRFRCHEVRVVPGYLELALNSPSVVEAIDRQKAGINESGVSLTHGKLGGVLIPLPPILEQTRIVAEVEQQLSVVEELEAVVSANLQRGARLRQSILQKAFTGNL
jgi:restriction endonuclease S subunit